MEDTNSKFYTFETYPFPTPSATFDHNFIYLDGNTPESRKEKRASAKKDFQKFARTKGKREWDY